MQWGSVSGFFAMGGYAGYVWGAYGVTVVLIVIEILALRARRRAALQDVTRRARRGSES